MNKPTLIALLIASASFSCLHLKAQDSRPLTITDAGYFLTTIDADGTPAYVKLTTVIDLTGGEKPDRPDEPDEPDEPNVDTELARKVRDWAKSVGDPQSSQAIAAVYSHVRGAVSNGTLTDATVWPALQRATDSALDLINSGKDWAPFRGQLTGVLTEAKQRGLLQTTSQIERLLLSVQYGVELSADGSTALSMDQMVELATRTNAAIDGATK